MTIPFLSITILNSIAPPLQSSLCMDEMNYGKVPRTYLWEELTFCKSTSNYGE